jgi:alpha-L-fucosidase
VGNLAVALLSIMDSRKPNLNHRRPLLVIYAIFLSVTMAYAQDQPNSYHSIPSQRQLEWHQLEYYAFIHFGPNTFTNEEWGRSQSSPDVFNPTGLDTDQWAKSFYDAGMKAMILTAKHHDGMALWNTTTTTYKIGNGSWAKRRAAQGIGSDVVVMAAESAKKYGLKFGVYLSPWDMHRDPSVPKAGLRGTIYEEPQIFGDSNPGDYNDLYANQLTELMTTRLADGSKVEIFEVWLDGASGSNTVQTFDWSRFRDIIRQHQPKAIMWGHQGVDARWVGNEDGVSATTNWHTISRTQDQSRYEGSQLEAGVRDGQYWTPAEADARLRDGWFYHSNERPKSGAALMSMYLQSVGRSVNLLLDVPPNSAGVLVQEDIEALRKFKNLRDEFFDRKLTNPGLRVAASNSRGGSDSQYGPAKVIDGNESTYWAMDDTSRTGWVEIDLGGAYLVEAFIAKEYIALGQRIGGYVIEALVNGAYRSIIMGTSLGYQRVDRLSVMIETTQIRFRVTQANAAPLISSIEVLGSKRN